MKQFACITLLFVMLVVISACTQSSNVVGVWEQKMDISILGVEGAVSAPSVCRFTFREDGTGVQEQILEDGKHPTAVQAFAYSLEKNSLILDYGDNRTETFTVTLDNSLLKLENSRGCYELTRAE